MTDAGSTYSEVKIDITDITRKLSILGAQYSKAATFLRAFGETGTKSIGAILKSTAALQVAFGVVLYLAIVKLNKAIRASIKIMTEYNQSIANTQSVARGTVEELDRLDAAARRSGETTRFTATEAADALYYLASAGFEATEAIEALEGVLALAQATGTDMAITAEEISVVISQFGLDASESARVANVFAAAITNSQATMEKMIFAFQQAGPIAAGLGIELEETAASMELLFNAGFRGQRAGRALRNIMGDLSFETSATSKKLKALGLDFEKFTTSSNTLTEAFTYLNESGISTSQVFAAFGKVASAQAEVLVRSGAEAWKSMTDAVTDTNKAYEAAFIQNDTLEGDLLRLKSASEALGVTFGNIFEPALRKVRQAQVTVVRSLNTLVKSLSGAMTEVTYMADNLNLAELALAGYQVNVDQLADSLDNLSDKEKKQLERQIDKYYKEASQSLAKVANTYVAIEDKVESGRETIDRYNAAINRGKENIEALEEQGQNIDQVLSNPWAHGLDWVSDYSKALEKIGPTNDKVVENLEKQDEAIELLADSYDQWGDLLYEMLADYPSLIELIKEEVQAREDSAIANGLSNAATAAGLETTKEYLELLRKQIGFTTDYTDALKKQQIEAKNKEADELAAIGRISEAYRIRQTLLFQEMQDKRKELKEKKAIALEEVDVEFDTVDQKEVAAAARALIDEDYAIQSRAIMDSYWHDRLILEEKKGQEEIEITDEKNKELEELAKNTAKILLDVANDYKEDYFQLLDDINQKEIDAMLDVPIPDYDAAIEAYNEYIGKKAKAAVEGLNFEEELALKELELLYTNDEGLLDETETYLEARKKIEDGYREERESAEKYYSLLALENEKAVNKAKTELQEDQLNEAEDIINKYAELYDVETENQLNAMRERRAASLENIGMFDEAYSIVKGMSDTYYANEKDKIEQEYLNTRKYILATVLDKNEQSKQLDNAEQARRDNLRKIEALQANDEKQMIQERGDREAAYNARIQEERLKVAEERRKLQEAELKQQEKKLEEEAKAAEEYYERLEELREDYQKFLETYDSEYERSYVRSQERLAKAAEESGNIEEGYNIRMDLAERVYKNEEALLTASYEVNKKNTEDTIEDEEEKTARLNELKTAYERNLTRLGLIRAAEDEELLDNKIDLEYKANDARIKEEEEYYKKLENLRKNHQEFLETYDSEYERSYAKSQESLAKALEESGNIEEGYNIRMDLAERVYKNEEALLTASYEVNKKAIEDTVTDEEDKIVRLTELKKAYELNLTRLGSIRSVEEKELLDNKVALEEKANDASIKEEEEYYERLEELREDYQKFLETYDSEYERAYVRSQERLAKAAEESGDIEKGYKIRMDLAERVHKNEEALLTASYEVNKKAIEDTVTDEEDKIARLTELKTAYELNLTRLGSIRSAEEEELLDNKVDLEDKANDERIKEEKYYYDRLKELREDYQKFLETYDSEYERSYVKRQENLAKAAEESGNIEEGYNIRMDLAERVYKNEEALLTASYEVNKKAIEDTVTDEEDKTARLTELKKAYELNLTRLGSIRSAEEEELLDNKVDLEEKANDARIKEEEDYYKKLENLRKDYQEFLELYDSEYERSYVRRQERLATELEDNGKIKEAYDIRESLVERAFSSEEALLEARYEAEKKATEETIEDEEEKTTRLTELENAYNENLSELRSIRENDLKELSEEEVKTEKEAADEKLKIEEDYQKALADIREDYESFGTMFDSELASMRDNKLEEEATRLESLGMFEEAYNKRLEILNNYIAAEEAANTKAYDKTKELIEKSELNEEDKAAAIEELDAARLANKEKLGELETQEAARLLREQGDLEAEAAAEAWELEQKESEKRRKLKEKELDEEEKRQKELAEKWKDFYEQLTDLAQEAWDTTFNIASMINNKIYEEKKRLLDQQLLDELEAAGVSEKTEQEKLEQEIIDTRESYAKKIAEARENADEEKVLELQQARDQEEIELQSELTRQKIKDEFAVKKAELEYAQALSSWKLDSAAAIGKSALAVIEAIGSAPWPFNLPAIGFATLSTGAAIGTIATSKPVYSPPMFYSGGIVQGSSEGTQLIAGERNRTEAIVNPDQMANLLMAIANGGGSPEPNRMTVIIQTTDKKELARYTIDSVNRGQYLIDPKKGIRKI